MKKSHFLLVFCIALLAVQCQQPETETTTTPAVDVAAEEQSLMQADKQWSEASATHEGHMSYFADDAIVFAANQPTTNGKQSIHEMTSGMYQMPDATVSWTPTNAEVAASGDLGYTWGTYTYSMTDSAGNAISDNGKYLTVWEKQDDGNWKVIADAYSTDMPNQ